MKYAIIINSLTGNTKLLADTIYNQLNKDDVIYFGPNNKKALKADLIYVGFWTNMSTCDEKSKEFLNMLNNKKVFLFGTAGFMSEEYKKEIINNTSKNINNTNEIVGSFMCQGKMQERVKEKYLKMKASNSHPNVDFLLANYEKALLHPNKDDFNNLIKVLIK